MYRFRPLVVHFTLFLIITGYAATACTASVPHAAGTGTGTLLLVSLGTGDADNMTLRARQAVIDADIIFSMGARTDAFAMLLAGKTVYDAGHRLFFEGQPKARRGHVGPQPAAAKAKGQPGASAGHGPRMHRSPEEIAAQQEKTRRIIRESVAAGKHVVIIDNGDPTIFGPHIDYMREFADLNPQIVPGISSFNAANAALQTSLMSGEARAATLTIGSLADERAERLSRMIEAGETLVFFMVRDFDEFVAGLNARVAADTPVAIVAHAGSRERQRVIRGSLGTILETVGGQEMRNYLFYVGKALK